MHMCPVCGYPGLPRAPRDYLICSCCGTEFGYHDFAVSPAVLRKRWVERGAPWFSPSRRPPAGWDPMRQMEEAGLLGPRVSAEVDEELGTAVVMYDAGSLSLRFKEISHAKGEAVAVY